MSQIECETTSGEQWTVTHNNNLEGNVTFIGPHGPTTVPGEVVKQLVLEAASDKLVEALQRLDRRSIKDLLTMAMLQ